MKDLETKTVWCVFMKEGNNDHRELIDVELSETEADEFIKVQVMNWLSHEKISECSVESYDDGVTVKHYCERNYKANIYDRSISWTKDKDYAKLVFEQE